MAAASSASGLMANCDDNSMASSSVPARMRSEAAGAATGCNSGRRFGVCSCATIAGSFKGAQPQEIIATLLQEHGVRARRFVLRHSHEVREYYVQYRETDLAFVQRLAAEEGLFYFHAGVTDDGQPLLVWGVSRCPAVRW